jgi:hypothetical protein
MRRIGNFRDLQALDVHQKVWHSLTGVIFCLTCVSVKQKKPVYLMTVKGVELLSNTLFKFYSSCVVIQILKECSSINSADSAEIRCEINLLQPEHIST